MAARRIHVNGARGWCSHHFQGELSDIRIQVWTGAELQKQGAQVDI